MIRQTVALPPYLNTSVFTSEFTSEFSELFCIFPIHMLQFMLSPTHAAIHAPICCNAPDSSMRFGFPTDADEMHSQLLTSAMTSISGFDFRF